MNIVLRFHVKPMTLANSEIADLVGLVIALTLAKKAWRHYMPISSGRDWFAGWITTGLMLFIRSLGLVW